MKQKKVLSYLTQRQLKPIVDSYVSKSVNHGFNELRKIFRKYQETKDINDLRYLLALCLRCRHGRRMPWKDTENAVNILLDNNILCKTFNNFEDLYDEVRRLLEDIHFVRGRLTLYDTAINIGQLLTPIVEPKDFVYLAAGAREGAGYVIGKKNVDWRVEKDIFGNLFLELSSIDIENVLCIYKNQLKELANGGILSIAEIDGVFTPCCFSPISKKIYISRLNNCNIFY